MKTLLIDNYDSYTYNLFQLIADVNGVEPDVVRNDDLTWKQLSERIANGHYRNVVISPGPGTPHCAADIGICEQLLQADCPLPVLGVCLGMQALAVAHGASVQHAPEPIHGRLSHIEHTSHPLFHNIPSGVDSPFSVVRYHSLAVMEATLPDSLKAIAWTCGGHTALRTHSAPAEVPQASSKAARSCAATDKVVQAIAHASLPLYGVQFHPESIGTAFGHQLLHNFAAITAQWHGLPPLPSLSHATGVGGSAMPASAWQHAAGPPSLELKCQKLEGLLKAVGGAEGIFMNLYGNQGAQDTFWLDSSASDRGRFSYLGGRGGPLWRRIIYQLPPPPSQTPSPSTSPSNSTAPADQLQVNSHSISHSPVCAAQVSDQGLPGTLTVEGPHGQIDKHQLSIWDYLNEVLQDYKLPNTGGWAEQLPFDFWGGLVGYLGYELKAELGGVNLHQAATPDAAMFLADRLIAVDHLHSNIYLLALAHPKSASSQDSAQQWLSTTAAQLQQLSPRTPLAPSAAPASSSDATAPVSDATAPFADAAADVAGDDMSQLSSQTHQHMDTTSSSALSDDDMLDDDQAYISASRSYRGRPAQLTPGATTTSHRPAAAGAHHTRHQPSQSGHCQAQQPASDRATDPCQASDRSSDAASASTTCMDSQQASDRCTYGAGLPRRAAAPPFKLARSRQQYLRDVAACQQALHDGDSYEICLTTALTREHQLDPLQLYRTLRRVNAAPYAAWLSFGADDLQICCASPERFLKGGRGGSLEAKPIKGTAPRFQEAAQDRASALALARSEKDQAENLMIVDLLRNDLGRVCQVGSVHVPALMEVESFATVHQLVSTVRGQRQPHKSIIDCIKAAFPGGSMTGAPKIRSMQILDSLEKEARGVYSGSLGFIGFNDTFDLNIVIRTAVMHEGRMRIGAGGAIVVQSDVVGEYDEMRLKANALLKAVAMSNNEVVCPAEVDVGDS